MWIRWIYYCGIVFFILSPVQGTNRHEPLACNCNGKSIGCIWDTDGPRCLNCQENTEGRQCERCKEGFYHQRAGDPCLPCNCNSAGSTNPQCDAAGVCSCKRGVRGDKCDRCNNGAPVTPIGCTQSCRTRSSSQPLSGQPECPSCFCHGHSDTCSPAEGYSVLTISSSFSSGTEGWRAAAAYGTAGSSVRFQWSSRLRSLEVFSDSSVPLYLLAPASYLGNQQLSYGQTLSFSLRLDWGVRYPSTSDVVLEGGGLRVAAPLGDLHRVIPCGQKTTYSFRLDESPVSKWQPTLTSLQFQILLQNVTAIKIRGTFGRRSRSYLDDVQLVSARQGPGTPAGWVGKCSCPVGHEGQFCERCAVGYRKMDPAKGPFSQCTPCSNADTGECLPRDDSSRFPPGVDCSVTPGSIDGRCDRCSPGTTGARCNMCEDGFYGDPLGESGPRQPCQRCQCNGNIDPNAVGNCHRLTGQCLQCLNHTTGFFCESCQDGFHRSHASDNCKACNCNPLGSTSRECSSSGQCLCREAFEGPKCDRPACPSCFDRVKHKVGVHFSKLHELEGLLQKIESDVVPANTAQLLRHIQLAELILAEMQMNSNQLTDTENGLLGRLEELSQAQSRESSSLQSVSDTLGAVSQQERQYQRRASDIDLLLRDVRHQLLKAKTDIRNAELALHDDNGDTTYISSLAEKAVNLAKKQQGEADMVDQTAKSALAEAENAKGLIRPVLLGENKVAELVNDLQIGYKWNSTFVTGMKKEAALLRSSAERESRAGEGALKRVSQLEPLLDGVQGMDGVVSDLGTLKESTETSLLEYQDLKAGIEAERSGMSDLLAKGEAAQQIHNQLLSRANAAKANADASLMDITKNMDGLLNVHSKLEGFSKQLSTNRAEAERSLERLRDIADVVQGAVSSNTQSLDIMGRVQGDYREALGTFRNLRDAVTYTEELPPTLRASHDMLKDVATLAGDMKQLEAEATSRMKELALEAERAKQREMEAREASAQAAGTSGFVKGVKDSVDKTLQYVGALLSTSSSPGSTDITGRKSYNELELSIADARKMVTQLLKPRLQKLEEMEASQMAKAMSLNADIDNILLDIKNLQDIQRTIPVGCFNAQPIESP
nr:laminin subunit gamma-2-like [Paramormyrops kingsleyae]